MTIWVGRYAIVEGAVREHGPWFIERTRTREDETVRLLVLAEPADERSADFCAQVADAVAELFASESLSVTGGLLRAIRQAHANLVEWNARSLREHRVSVGITAVAIRDLDVTIAQAGPGLAYLSGPEGVQRLEPAEGSEAARPVGGADSVEPQFFQTTVDGHLVLLVTSSVEQAVGTQAIGSALAAGPDRALAELFVRTRQIPDMNAVLVANIDLPEELLEPGASPDGAKAVAGEDAEIGAEGAGVVGVARRAWRDPWAAIQMVARTVDSGSEYVAPQSSETRLPALRRDRGPYGTTTSPLGALSRIGVRRAAQPGELRRQWRAIAVAGLALFAVIVLGWCTLPSFIREDQRAQIEAALSTAQGHLTASTQAIDLVKSRSELDAARTEVARARGLGPDDQRVIALQAQLDTHAKSRDAVTELGDGLKRVAAFEGVITAPFNAAGMVFGDNALWMLDSQRGRLFRVNPLGKAEPQEVYRSGGTYGGATARDPRALAWDTAGQRLLPLDSGSTLFAITTGKPPVPVAMRGARDIKSIAGIAVYNANLYALDPQGGEIWRYLPGGDGFDSERSALLGGIELLDARGLAVDGDFYVLGASGVRHFRPQAQNRELSPLFQGIDRAPVSAIGLAADTQRHLFYVGDRGNRRVVVSDREGVYRRQYRHMQFFDLRGVALSADASTAYILTGDGVFSFQPTP